MSPELHARLQALAPHQKSLLIRTLEQLGDRAHSLDESDYHALVDEVTRPTVTETIHAMNERERAACASHILSLAPHRSHSISDLDASAAAQFVRDDMASAGFAETQVIEWLVPGVPRLSWMADANAAMLRVTAFRQERERALAERHARNLRLHGDEHWY